MAFEAENDIAPRFLTMCSRLNDQGLALLAIVYHRSAIQDKNRNKLTAKKRPSTPNFCQPSVGIRPSRRAYDFLGRWESICHTECDGYYKITALSFALFGEPRILSAGVKIFLGQFDNTNIEQREQYQRCHKAGGKRYEPHQ